MYNAPLVVEGIPNATGHILTGIEASTKVFCENYQAQHGSGKILDMQRQIPLTTFFWGMEVDKGLRTDPGAVRGECVIFSAGGLLPVPASDFIIMG